MRQFLLAALALGSLAAAPVSAQTPRVSLSVALGPDNLPMHARRARVQVRDLLGDKRWSDALEQLFPIRLSFRLEIWRSRDGWIDEFQRAAEWSTVIQREPLQDQYRVTRLLLSGPEEFRFATRDELERWLRYTTEVDALPQGTGSFYYTVTLTITALSNEDMEKLERFLAGQDAAPVQPENNSLGKRVRQFLLRIAGLPWEELEVRSEKFRVSP
ncbi:MAG TPA: DUF4390 domain-containing protein [Gemmatimonadales bacterium]|nr:DUF4390 domain-containing protein [Gemmatimonadales bacterium]